MELIISVSEPTAVTCVEWESLLISTGSYWPKQMLEVVTIKDFAYGIDSVA